MPPGAIQEGQGRVQAEEATGLGAHAFIRVHVWSTLGLPG